METHTHTHTHTHTYKWNKDISYGRIKTWSVNFTNNRNAASESETINLEI
jgi:hypothetical protein